MKTARIIIYLYSSIYTAHKSQVLNSRTMHSKKEYASLTARGKKSLVNPNLLNQFAEYYPATTSKICKSKQDLELRLLGGLGGNLLVHAVDLGLEGARRLGALELQSVLGLMLATVSLDGERKRRRQKLTWASAARSQSKTAQCRGSSS